MLNDLIIVDGVSDEYLRKIKAFVRLWNDASETITVSTSGSTGTPKEIELSKKRVRASANYTAKFFGFEKGQTALLNLSPDYIAGKLMIVRAIENNMNLMIAPLSGDPLKNVNDEPIAFGAFVPAQINEILKNEHSKEILARIGNVIIGGAPISPEVENELTAISSKIYASFGMTETITHFALRRLGTPIYNCLDGYKIALDKRSCLVVKKNKVVEKTLVTNDVIDYINSTTFKWKGRLDNVINSGGIKIYPEKIEKMIAHLLPDNRFYVTSKKDDKFGEVAVLVVEGEVDNEKLLNDAKDSVPRYHAPKEVIVEDVLEETPTQKIIRKKF
ncbi:AMP-binding protein [Paracrocinitomix mangrovi]|uniref:AMP-binding protein n=1 Tax=Paracrocinitomix mangrovi TaxID=2862509 RepID=UPI001C8D309A|nr:AMP-binding protein [Paracrocinitomix mangrovi]UKN01279.1 AMP-binding protein [Paracrocinitomix mangrovi]